MREGLIEVLSEVGSGMRQIFVKECFDTLADILLFILTLFVHEDFLDSKLLYTIMVTSGRIFMKKNDEA